MFPSLNHNSFFINKIKGPRKQNILKTTSSFFAETRSFQFFQNVMFKGNLLYNPSNFSFSLLLFRSLLIKKNFQVLSAKQILKANNKFLDSKVENYLLNGDEDSGIKLFHELKQIRKPPLDSYITLIARVNNPQNTINLFREMLHVPSFVIDEKVYRAMFSRYKTLNQIEKLLPLLSRIPELLNDALFWRYFNNVYINANNLTSFQKALEKLNISPFEESFYPSAILNEIRATLFLLAVRANQTELVNDIIKMEILENPSLKYHHLYSFIKFLSEGSQPSLVEVNLKKIFNYTQIKKLTLSSEELTKLNNLYISSQMAHPTPVPVTDLLNHFYSTKKEILPNYMTYVLLFSLAKSQDLPRLFDTFLEDEFVPSRKIFSIMLRAYTKELDSEQIMNTLDYMTIWNMEPDASTYQEIAEMFQKLNRSAHANYFLNLSQTKKNFQRTYKL